MEKMMSKIDLELMIDTAITEHRGGNHKQQEKYTWIFCGKSAPTRRE